MLRNPQGTIFDSAQRVSRFRGRKFEARAPPGIAGPGRTAAVAGARFSADRVQRHVPFIERRKRRLLGSPAFCAALTRFSGYNGERTVRISVVRAEQAGPEIAEQAMGEAGSLLIRARRAANACASKPGICLYGPDIDETTDAGRGGLAWDYRAKRRARRSRRSRFAG